MKKISALLFALSASFFVSAQDSTVLEPLSDTVPSVIDTLPITNPAELIEETESERKSGKMGLPQLPIGTRSKDHLLIQIGYDNWANAPDSINTKGLARSFNMYFMFDFPFKTNPKLSVGIGVGISTGSMYFSDTYIDIAGRSSTKLTFRDVSDTTHFKKYKLMTTYLEAPVELRYLANPLKPKKSFKAAIGGKIGTLIGATTKGKNLLSSTGQVVTAFTQKEKSKRYFNGTRLSVIGRVGYGSLSLFGSYQVNAFIKEGFGPDIKPYSIGITISGL